MPTVFRWLLTDPFTDDSYQFPYNPQRMGPIFPERSLSVRTTTAVGGQSLVFEGNTPAFEWTFAGVTLDKAHYEKLREWSEKKSRILLQDHFGRQFWVLLKRFVAEPENRKNRRWYHTYEMHCLVLSVPTDPTVGE